MIRYLCFVLHFVVTLGESTAEVVNIEERINLSLNAYLEISVDPVGTPKIDDVINHLENFHYQAVSVNDKGLIAPPTGWGRIQLDNPTQKLQWRYFSNSELLLGIPHFYYQQENGALTKVTYLRSHRSIFPIPFHPNSRTTLYFFIDNNLATKTRFTLLVLDNYLIDTSLAIFMVGGGLGIAIGILAISIFLARSLKKQVHVYYCLFLLSIILAYLVNSMPILFGIWEYKYLQRSSLTLILVFASIFSRTALQSKEILPWAHAWLSINIYFLALFIIFSITLLSELTPNSQQNFSKFLRLYSISCVLTFLVTGLLSWKKGLRMAKWYTMAWFFYVVCILIGLMELTGEPSTYFFSLGAMIENTLLAYALADIINMTRVKLTVVESEHQLIERELLIQKKLLELKTQNRREELENANDSLFSTIHKLKKTQNELIEIQKMAELGKLVSNIAKVTSPNIEKSRIIVSKIKVEFEFMKNKDQTMTKQELNHSLKSLRQTLPNLVGFLKSSSKTIMAFKNIALENNEDQFSEFSLNQLISSLVTDLCSQNKNVFFNPVIKSNIRMMGYKGSIIKILSRLIENVQQHAFQDHPDPIVDLVIEKRDGIVILEVNDNGVGIPVNELINIFDAFYTLENQQDEKRMGLGLHIVKNLVTYQLQGKIRCESGEGEGLSVIIEIPINLD